MNELHTEPLEVVAGGCRPTTDLTITDPTKYDPITDLFKVIGMDAKA